MDNDTARLTSTSRYTRNAVAVLVANRRGDLLMYQVKDQATQAWVWTVPYGRIRADENARDAALRLAGVDYQVPFVDADDMTDLFTVPNPDAFTNKALAIGTVWHGRAENVNIPNAAEVRFVPASEAVLLPMPPVVDFLVNRYCGSLRDWKSLLGIARDTFE